MNRTATPEFEDNPPDPGATIESLRSLGYSVESALADLVDNSVAADAASVRIQMSWDGLDTWCAVADDGAGMTDGGLKAAMRIGSIDPLVKRGEKDLGRFGFGLKTASFSQARELTVGTRRKAGGPLHTRSWDLDHVRATGRWEMRKRAQPQAAQIISECLATARGTCVIWRDLSQVQTGIEESGEQLAHDDFLRMLEVVERHLSMTFTRLLASRRLKLSLNGRKVEAWDPFVHDNPATQQLPAESLILRGHLVHVQPYVLPHVSKMLRTAAESAAGPSGWNQQQGFYVFRRDRLISAGDWLDRRLGRDDAYNLARISIDVPPELDHEWSLNITKTTINPPRPLVKDLWRIAEETRSRAKRVLTSRGGQIKPRNKTAAVKTVWTQTRHGNESTFRIDRSHPVVAATLDGTGSSRRSVEELLRIVERTIPVRHLPTSSPAGDADAAPLSAADRSGLYKIAEALYESLLSKGRSRHLAAADLRNIEPFDRYPEIVDDLTERS